MTDRTRFQKLHTAVKIVRGRGGGSWLYRNLVKGLFHYEVPRSRDYHYLARILRGKAPLAEENRQRAMNEIREGKTILTSNPIAIDYIGTFTGCNMRPPCPKCFAPPPTAIRYPWDGNLYKGLEEFLETASNIQEGTQGEILMLPYFEELIEATSQGRPRLCIVTNATLMDEDKIEAMVGRVNAICISLDSPHAEGYGKLQGRPEQFEKVVSSARELVARRNASGSRFPLIQFGYTLCNENMEDFMDFCKLGAEIGVDRVVAITLLGVEGLEARKVRPVKRGGFSFIYREQVPAEEDAYRTVQRAKKEFEGSPLIVWTDIDQIAVTMCINDRELDLIEGPTCATPWTCFVPCPDGQVSHCVWGGGYKVGNWRRQGPKGVWNCSEMQQIREDFLKFGIARPCLMSQYCPLTRRVRMFAERAGKGSLLDEALTDWSKAPLLLPFIKQAIENTARARSWVIRNGKRVRLADIDL